MADRIQKIRKIGNSAGILLPADWLTQAGLKPGEEVRVDVTDRRITIFPKTDDREVEVDARFARQVETFLKRNREILARLS